MKKTVLSQQSPRRSHSPRNEIYTGSFRFNEGVPLKS
jgi:hypothetical protein